MNVIAKIHQIITGYEKKEAKGFEVWIVMFAMLMTCLKHMFDND